MDAGCALCDELKRKDSVAFETENAFVLVNLRPLKLGHIMILPKRHVEVFDGLTPSEAHEMFSLIERCTRALGKEYKVYPFVCINPPHRRSELHVHIHLVPSSNGVREFLSRLENVPMNEEAPKHIRLEMKDRISRLLSSQKP